MQLCAFYLQLAVVETQYPTTTSGIILQTGEQSYPQVFAPQTMVRQMKLEDVFLCLCRSVFSTRRRTKTNKPKWNIPSQCLQCTINLSFKFPLSPITPYSDSVSFQTAIVKKKKLIEMPLHFLIFRIRPLGQDSPIRNNN